MQKIKKIEMSEMSGIEECVIVIDVIRAFTVAAYAFAKGAKEIVLVKDISEAFKLQQQHSDWWLMGENGGRIPGFHLGNSPLEVFQAPISGKTLIQRTSHGTQGVFKAKDSQNILVSSFVVADATLHRIAKMKSKKITFLITAPPPDGDEDWALANYLEKKLDSPDVESTEYLNQVRNSPSGMTFGSTEFPQEELEAICDLNRFGFAMEVFREGQLFILKPVTSTGELFYPVKV